MSIALPVLSNKSPFIYDLLREQSALTAVEKFSVAHRSSEHIQARYYRDLLPSSPPRPGHQFAFEVDLDKCSGCKACVVACHSMNGLDDDEIWRRVGTTTTTGPLGRTQHVTTACHHCEEPRCLMGCPVQAYVKDAETGIVQHLDDQCIGCKYCMMMCPYEVPQYSERLGIVRKCDMCHQRLAAGEAPACVQGCPNEAIAIREVAVGRSITPFDERLAPAAPYSAITKPTTVYKTSYRKHYHSSSPQDAGLASVADSHWPLAAMLVATQASVGLLLAERLFTWSVVLSGSDSAQSLTRLAALIALAFALLGVTVAPLHLGRPLRAWRIFLGLRTSWLSREAILLGMYVGLLTTAVALMWSPYLQAYLSRAVHDWLGMVPSKTADFALDASLLVGVLALISSAMIYIVTQRRLWRMSRTMPRFLGSAMITGIGLLLPILIHQSVPLAVYVAMVAISGLGIVIKLGSDTHVCMLSNATEEDRSSVGLAIGPMRSLLIVRLIMGMAALSLTVASGVSAMAGAEPASLLCACVAAALLIAGEQAERLLYFTTVVYDRMPGMLR